MSICHNRFESFFSVDGIHYRFFVTIEYEVIFEAVSGRLCTGEYINYDSWNSFDEISGTCSLLGKIKRPFTVLSIVLNKLKEYLATHKPAYFTFGAMETERIRVYKKLLNKINRETGYIPVYSENGSFIFVREQA